MFKKKSKSKKGYPELASPLTLSIENENISLKFPPQIVDSMRYMTTRLMYKGKLPQRLALASPIRQEGVTFISRALATTLANDFSFDICVVEMNWWWPDSSLSLNTNDAGLAAVLRNELSLEDALLRTGQSNLTLLPSGLMALGQRPVWARHLRLKEIIEDLSEMFDHLIFDIPALLATNDAIPLASLANACCLVINQGVTSIESARLALDEISHIHMAGVVMNKVNVSTPSQLLNLIPQDPNPLINI
ncbi:MAG: CpsD/CapB family tyrosine-protein kinase [Ardenticatenaceae bacterium]|nr:CpsD/CapB family tyrosine-protein kinase [Ardenticatenaceae bacterium]